MVERVSNFTRPIVWYPSSPPREGNKDSDSRKKSLSELRAKVCKTINESRELIERIENQNKSIKEQHREINIQHREIEAQHNQIRKQHQKIDGQHRVLKEGQKELWGKIHNLEEKIKAREIYTPPLQIKESNPNISEKKSYPKKDNKIYNSPSNDKKKQKLNSFFIFLINLKKKLFRFMIGGFCYYESDSLLSSLDGDAD